MLRQIIHISLFVLAVLISWIAFWPFGTPSRLLNTVVASTTQPAAESDPSTLPPLHTGKDPGATALLRGHALVTPGEFTVATVPFSLPLIDFAADQHTLVGVEPDMARLIADALGLKLKLVPIAWADWPLSLASGKYDAAICNITVTEERKQKFDFSSYRYDLLGIYARKSSKIQQIRTPKDVAGLKVAVGAGTNQEQILQRWNQANIAARLPPVQIQYYDDSPLARLAVLSGRVDISFEPNASGAYAVAHNGKLRRVGLLPGGWPRSAAISVATRKGSGLAPAITGALNAQIDNGKYRQVLARWHLSEEAVPRSQTNPPGLPEIKTDGTL